MEFEERENYIFHIIGYLRATGMSAMDAGIILSNGYMKMVLASGYTPEQFKQDQESMLKYYTEMYNEEKTP